MACFKMLHEFVFGVSQKGMLLICVENTTLRDACDLLDLMLTATALQVSTSGGVRPPGRPIEDVLQGQV